MKTYVLILFSSDSKQRNNTKKKASYNHGLGNDRYKTRKIIFKASYNEGYPYFSIRYIQRRVISTKSGDILLSISISFNIWLKVWRKHVKRKCFTGCSVLRILKRLRFQSFRDKHNIDEHYWLYNNDVILIIIIIIMNSYSTSVRLI